MKKKILLVLLLCLIPVLVTGCGTGKNDNSGLGKYVEFRQAKGYYEGNEYTVELPYLRDENSVAQRENEYIEQFAIRIEESSKELGYMVDVSCVLTDDNLISIRLTGKYDTGYEADPGIDSDSVNGIIPQDPHDMDNPSNANFAAGYGSDNNDTFFLGTDGHIRAFNYNITDGTSSAVATTDFPHSENYAAWLRRYINDYYKEADYGKTRIYNFNVPYIYYTDDSKLMAAVTFTKLFDGGEIRDSFEELDLTKGPKQYFSRSEFERIEEMTSEGFDGLPLSGSARDINDEYGIFLTYYVNGLDRHISHLFALGQQFQGFPNFLDNLSPKVSFEDGELAAGDYTKVYTFTDDRGYNNFVLKTQYWGERDWKAGFEKICYVGVDTIDGAIAGTVRGYHGMEESELLKLYPHDLYVTEKINPQAHFALNMSKPTKAYIYKDPEDMQNQNSDLVFIVKNGIVVSIDAAVCTDLSPGVGAGSGTSTDASHNTGTGKDPGAGQVYSRYDALLNLSKLVSVRNNKAVDLDVKAISSYKGEFDIKQVVPDHWGADELTGDDRLIKVAIKVPGIDARVPDSAKINKMITNFSPYIIKLAEKLNKGDVKVLAETDLVGYASMDYKVHNYKNASALVVETKGYLFQAGGGNAYLIIYYDNDTGNIMTAREYLWKCGITEESLLELCTEKRYIPTVPGNEVVRTAYDVKFAVGNNGQIILYTEMSD